ncbi:MAG: hypothetical protein LUG12_01255 [Erysipelotrichaceae bacterium]|nr:hypothetical protein [Erysipelotrichaceae bacterium]
MCEVYDEIVEISVFSAIDRAYEIYFGYKRFYGIVYAEANKAYEIRDKMKAELQADYDKNNEPSGEFINYFHDKYHVDMPFNIFFDLNLEDFFKTCMKSYMFFI